VKGERDIFWTLLRCGAVEVREIQRIHAIEVINTFWEVEGMVSI
jgi:hypothetical protein